MYKLLLLQISLFTSTLTLSAQTYNLIKTISPKTQSPALNFNTDTWAVAVDTLGYVFVADRTNQQILKYNSDGVFILKWGVGGRSDEAFNNPNGIKIDAKGDVYVADQSNNRIQKFSNDGVFITKWTTNNSGYTSFPSGVSGDYAGNIYVSNYINEIRKYTSSGNLISIWPTIQPGEVFSQLAGLAADSAGNIYVMDEYNNMIKKFNSSGTLLQKWGKKGCENGQFSGPNGVVDKKGNLFVVSLNCSKVQKFTSDGVFIESFITQAYHSRGIAVDKEGNIYVADNGSNRVLVYKKDNVTGYHSDEYSKKTSSHFSASPNPNNGSFTLHTSGENATVTISDIQGNVNCKFNTFNSTLDYPVEGLNSGFYVVKILEGEMVQNIKIVVE
ncbi:MAG: T9SS type A sorting domain-containing protein [Opitutaceae bacterium]|nr:T9SS type A sorting domain-containing protein [Cytophagales bacterium]